MMGSDDEDDPEVLIENQYFEAKGFQFETV
jgi:hypothetical protein